MLIDQALRNTPAMSTVLEAASKRVKERREEVEREREEARAGPVFSPMVEGNGHAYAHAHVYGSPKLNGSPIPALPPAALDGEAHFVGGFRDTSSPSPSPVVNTTPNRFRMLSPESDDGRDSSPHPRRSLSRKVSGMKAVKRESSPTPTPIPGPST
jgi:hypothetical protein